MESAKRGRSHAISGSIVRTWIVLCVAAKSSGHHHSLSLVMRFQLQRFRKLRQTEIAWKGSPRRSRAPGQERDRQNCEGEKNARHHWDLPRNGTTSQQNTRGSKRLANSAKR